MTEMNTVTQKNAANSEESSAAASALSDQAEELASMVGTFRLDSRFVLKRSLGDTAAPAVAALGHPRPPSRWGWPPASHQPHGS